VTKKDIIRAISEELGLPQLQASEIVHKLFDAIVNRLVKEGRLELRNFGIFEVRWRKPRKARNPRTGEPVTVPKKCTVTFTPGLALAERVESESRTAAAGRKTRSKLESVLGGGTARSGD
jgi:nucleoid DNA-binding protein